MLSNIIMSSSDYFKILCSSTIEQYQMAKFTTFKKYIPHQVLMRCEVCGNFYDIKKAGRSFVQTDEVDQNSLSQYVRYTHNIVSVDMSSNIRHATVKGHLHLHRPLMH
jgi:hypothetical protein